MKRILIATLLLLNGCGSPRQATVYGRSGAMYQAPALCEALVKCLNSNERECIYESYQYTTASGSDFADTCKTVSK
jgi:hypothetical protein